ncbi:(4Fe-4S)-binding protein [Lacihabitans soyangensis]|uniref:(4Fe-4S)-binding protein n=1 Tax=Lacihabitans soyangensis TaxID=869394 RepID=A0AAE3KU31_9BACT|nr:(4Fe-4S)-binding protein [Lacihabitans soyangensis]MCP9764439.1 (4Fe-4S)-binding protein [Lacihabitans soyangensis]
MDPKNIKKEYTNGDITVVWQSAMCIHSAMCVKNLPEVFQPKISPWVKMDAASSQEILEAVKKCPSGALSIK